MIALLLLKYLRLQTPFGWSLSNLVALLRMNLFVYRDLWTWLNDPFTAPPLPPDPSKKNWPSRKLDSSRRCHHGPAPRQPDSSNNSGLISARFRANLDSSDLQRYPDVVETDQDPLAHYIVSGGRERRAPNLLFDACWYLEQLPGATAGWNPLLHYLENGAREGRYSHPLFDVSFYLEHNPDVAAAGTEPLAHYLTVGGLQGQS